jgi:hypothetical protein
MASAFAMRLESVLAHARWQTWWWSTEMSLTDQDTPHVHRKCTPCAQWRS